MKNIILGNNDDSMPKQGHLLKGSKSSEPFLLRVSQERESSHNTHIDLVLNGKAIVFKEALSSNVEDHNQYLIDSSFTFCTLLNNNEDHNTTAVIERIQFSSKTYYHHVSNSCRFVIMALNLGNGMLSLVGRMLCNETNTDENSADTILFTIQPVHTREIIEVSMILTMDDQMLCVILEGSENGSYFCEAHFFKCSTLPDDGQLSLEKIHSLKLHLLGLASIYQVNFNITGDKIIFLSNEYDCLVYSLCNQSVIAFQENIFFLEFGWSIDSKRGEILVNFDWQQCEIYIFTINYNANQLTKLRQIELSKFFGDLEVEDRMNIVFRLSSCTSLIMLSLDEDIFLVDPFTGLLVQKLKSLVCPGFVCDIRFNWCSNELVVCSSNFSNQYYAEVYRLNQRSESLFISALKIVFLSYPVNDLMQKNLPKTIKKYFMN